MPRQPASKAKKTLYAQEVRMETFRGAKMAHSKSRAKVRWPHTRPTPESMALAGLYFEPEAKNPDRVTCYVCGTSFDGWEEDDDPTHEHYQFAPECALAKIQYKPWEYEDDFDLAASPFNPHSEMVVNARLETYGDLWPHEKNHGWMCSSFNMAKAGLYFNPLGPDDDDASCAYCSVTLGGWDPTDNPLEEHRRRSADCKFFVTEPPINTRNSSVEPEALASGIQSDSEVEQVKTEQIESTHPEEPAVEASPQRGRTRTRKRKSNIPDSETEEVETRTRSRSRSVAQKSQKGRKTSSTRLKTPRPTRARTKTRLSVFDDDDDPELADDSDDLELDPKPLKAAGKSTKSKAASKTRGKGKAKIPDEESEEDEVDEDHAEVNDNDEINEDVDDVQVDDDLEDQKPDSSVDASVEAELERLEKSVKLGKDLLPSLAPSPETSKLFAQLKFDGPVSEEVLDDEKNEDQGEDEEEEETAHDSVLHHQVELDEDNSEHESVAEEDSEEEDNEAMVDAAEDIPDEQSSHEAMEDAAEDIPDEQSDDEAMVEAAGDESEEDDAEVVVEAVGDVSEEQIEIEQDSEPIEIDEVKAAPDLEVTNSIPGGFPSPVHDTRSNATSNSRPGGDTTIKAAKSLVDKVEDDGSKTVTVVEPVKKNTKGTKKRPSQSVDESKAGSAKKQRKSAKKVNSSSQHTSTLLSGLAGDDEEDDESIIVDKRTSHVSQMRLSQNWTRFGESSPEAEHKTAKAFALDDEDSSKPVSPERPATGVVSESPIALASSSESEVDKENMPPTPPQIISAAATPKQVRIVDVRDDEELEEEQADDLFAKFNLLDPDSALVGGDSAQMDLSTVKEDCLDLTLVQFFAKLADQSVAGIEGEFQKKTDLVRDQGLRAIKAIESMAVADP